MDISGGLGVMAVLFACVGGSALATPILKGLYRKRLFNKGLQRTALQLLYQKGVLVLYPLCERLLHVAVVESAIHNLQETLEAKGRPSSPCALCSSLMVFLAMVMLIGFVLTGSVLGGIALSCCVLGAMITLASSQLEKQRVYLRESVPTVMHSMTTCFQSGLSLLQTLENIAEQERGIMKHLFRQASETIKTGGSVTEALESFKSSNAPQELAFVAVALDVQHQCGGALEPVLHAARASVEDELELLRSMKVQTAQARLSARIVTLMPFLLVSLFSLINNDFLTPFFESSYGVVLLAIALVMQASGVLVVRRMLRLGEEQ